ncbi:TIGR04222 domain-containing membrane protein [Streptomyces sp. NPDC051582]|uniref:TIGR04222 domain-containing membrane protein n=1 Tax=Streptomyces sp. NPDC051582 TaxID=3155167 RepID=UPI00341901F3
MITEVSSAAAALLPAAAAALRFLPRRGSLRDPVRQPLTPVETALLRGGARGAVRTALVELYLVGSVEPAWRHTVRRTAVPPTECSDLARAVYRVLHGRPHPRRLEREDRVREAIAASARQLGRDGLLLTRRRRMATRALLLPVFAVAPVTALIERATPPGPTLLLALLADGAALLLWLWPRRTGRGCALLVQLRREQAGTRRPTEREPARLLLIVALFGAPALREILPRFTEESGMLVRPPREPMERGGGGPPEVFTCGG